MDENKQIPNQPQEMPLDENEFRNMPETDLIGTEAPNISSDTILFTPVTDESAAAEIDFDPLLDDDMVSDEPTVEVEEAETSNDTESEYHSDIFAVLGLDEDFSVGSANAHETVYQEANGDSEEFHAMFHSTPEQEEEKTMSQTKTRHARKGRPKRKKGDGLLGIPHLISTVIWLALIIAIGVSLGRLLWVCASDVLAFGREDKVVTITIEQDDTIDDIADKLYQAGLIRYRSIFKLYAQLAVDDGDISTGTFELNTLYDYHALVGGMSSSSSYRSVVEDVLIPEGYNCRQIFELLEAKGICTVAELEEYAANGEFSDFWFLEGVQRGDKYCLEGYLFPDTYDFYAGSTPREALGKMLTGFNNRVTEEYTQQLTSLNAHISAKMRADGRSEQYIADHQFTFRDVITVASLIEKETSSANESYTIASVIYNRLFSWGSTPAYLNIDAAIIYATGDPDNIDTSIDHPYNTYKHTGLTPGPITNPGLDSIKAALTPAETKYFYYVLNPATGKHVFSRTLEEHEKYVKQFAQASEGQ